MKLRALLAAVLLLLLVGAAAPASAGPEAGNAAADAGTAEAVRLSAAAWDRIPAAVRPGARLQVAPLRFAAFDLDASALLDVLQRAPREGHATPDGPFPVVIPTPDGGFARFAITASPVMEAGLAARHPEIATYVGRGLDDPAATIRLSVTPLGFHASVHADGHAWYVDPRYRGDATTHVAYLRSDLPVPAWTPVKHEPLGYHDHDHGHDHGDAEHADEVADIGATAGAPVPLRVYRLALVTDPSYARNSGANDGLDPEAPDYLEQLNKRVTAAKAVMLNRVNHVYEADLGIRMLLIDATDRLNLNTAAQATGANGPCGAEACFPASNVSSCSSGGLTRNSTVTGLLAGARNFDVGHLALGVNGGGIAQLGVVGDTNKARGCTGLPRPYGDFFAIDYVAHEIGHQFGANHTFNGSQGSCAATNRNLTGATAVEPGSGSSVMAYAGICGVDDLQAHTDPYFSHASIAEMNAYTAGQATRSSVQLAALRGFDGTDSFTLGYGEARTAPIARGSSYTAAGIKAALEAILPAGGTVTVASVTDTGFSVTFGGTLAGTEEVELLDIELTGATGFVGETVAGGPTRRGGWPQASENTAPTVTAPASFTIPIQTPFTLTAQGSDADGDTLTYVWEQTNGGIPAVGSSLIEPVRAIGPLFRVFGRAARYADPSDAYRYRSPGQNLASTDPSRSFPDLAQVASGNTNALTGACPNAYPARSLSPEEVDCLSEVLPTAAWVGADGSSTLRFRVIARDNHPGAGGIATADTALALAKGAGPFRVLDVPTVLPPAAGTLPVWWDVARTDVLTGTTMARISLSTDGGLTFPHVLAASTPNDGNQVVPLPAGIATTKGRVKVEAVGNVFFDVNRTDLVIRVPAAR